MWFNCPAALSSVEMSRRESGNRFVFETKTDSFVLQTDIQRLQQVLINLLTNAAKFTKNGTIILQFEVEKEKNQVYVCGGGNRMRHSEGETKTGVRTVREAGTVLRREPDLGLSICKLTVDKWGGDILDRPGL